MAVKCTHVAEHVKKVKPHTKGCEECLKSGDTWVHLRMCLECGHVGCCDSSQNRHARAHFALASARSRGRRPVARFVLGDVLVDAGGDELLHAELDLALLGVDGEHLGLDDLAGAEDVGGVVDAAVGDDLADVDQAFDAVGELNEGAEVHDFGDRAFNLRADRELCARFGPGSARVCLRPRAMRRSSGLMERMTASTRSPCLRMSLGWRTFLPQAISEM
jgi:hypothetical protein